MGNSSQILSTPKVLRLEVMPLDFGEAAVVVELKSEPPKRWLKALKREMSDTEGLESASAKFDGCFVYVLGLEPSIGDAARRVSRLLAAVQERLVPGNGNSPETEMATARLPTPSNAGLAARVISGA
ncbi:MAG: hypothetical protein ABS932_04920 [Stenotrophomonas sp.]|uniref:hypothetical protein n=1 Tax=unclassified Stenotrophomonas TaxID=196198 RepID=UPI00249A1C9A|nr:MULTISPECIES: hypothetical protein [unclassified Stenotrophomonas]